MAASPIPILLTGATGYVGGQLLPELLRRGHPVRALVRSPDRAHLPDEVEVTGGDVVEGRGLDDALRGMQVAYYLVHSMGRGGDGDFAARDRRAARNFAEAATRAGVRRIIYLGGLEAPGDTESEHLRSREEVARVLAEGDAQVVHVRAAMVLGDGSASFDILNSLVKRLPVMVTPRWVDTRSQPIAIADVVQALAVLAEREEAPDEVQLGGADVLTYREMMGRFAKVAGRRPPAVIKVPILTPRLSSYWVTLVTPVESGLVRPLVDGLAAETIVREPPPPGINDHPKSFDEAVREALSPS